MRSDEADIEPVADELPIDSAEEEQQWLDEVYQQAELARQSLAIHSNVDTTTTEVPEVGVIEEPHAQQEEQPEHQRELLVNDNDTNDSATVNITADNNHQEIPEGIPSPTSADDTVIQGNDDTQRSMSVASNAVVDDINPHDEDTVSNSSNARTCE